MHALLLQLKQTALTELESATSPTDLEQIRVQTLGKKGSLTQILRGLGQVAEAERSAIGTLANAFKSEFSAAFTRRQEQLKELELKNRLDQEWVDVTLPGRGRMRGGI
ncbi:MAG: phenylalanine--tRNA ligase subunit alpha, partial [Magnetococcales bacterium]|nr:phenylalanine--tRNA ligase subunit alpha [Magnetococcales bacterium]